MAMKLFNLIVWISLILTIPISSFSQEDRIAQVAIDTFRANVRLPKGAEIKFIEKKESQIQDFYSIKLLIELPEKEIPAIVYVDKNGEKVILGNLIIRGENITAKEAGPSRLKKIEMGSLELDKSPFLGNKGAKVTIVEFSNFQCPYCMESWLRISELMKKYPEELKYVFKHFPFQPQGKTFELSEIAAAAQELGHGAFWIVHDFFFTKEGQDTTRLEKGVIKVRIEQLLKEKGYDLANFQAALETGSAKKRVLEDMALANRYRMTSTPTKIINGDMIVGLSQNNVIERYLGK